MAWLGQQQSRQAGAAKAARVSFAEPKDVSGGPVKISMYEEPPEGEVTIEEIERFALDRLRGETLGCCLVLRLLPILCRLAHLKFSPECSRDSPVNGALVYRSQLQTALLQASVQSE